MVQERTSTVSMETEMETSRQDTFDEIPSIKDVPSESLEFIVERSKIAGNAAFKEKRYSGKYDVEKDGIGSVFCFSVATVSTSEREKVTRREVLQSQE